MSRIYIIGAIVSASLLSGIAASAQKVMDPLTADARICMRGVKVPGYGVLDRDEIALRFGERNYYTLYRPYKTQMITGFAKMGVGLTLYIANQIGQLSKYDAHPEYVFSSYPFTGRSYTVTRLGETFYESGTYPGSFVFWGMVQYGLFWSGVTDWIYSAIGLGHLNKHYKEMDGARRGGTIAYLAAGAGLVLTGAGLLTYSGLELDKRSSWEHWRYTYGPSSSTPGKVVEYRNSAPPDDALMYCLIAGTASAYLGLTALQQGLHRYFAAKSLSKRATPSLSVAPLPGGAALSLRF